MNVYIHNVHTYTYNADTHTHKSTSNKFILINDYNEFLPFYTHKHIAFNSPVQKVTTAKYLSSLGYLPFHY